MPDSKAKIPWNRHAKQCRRVARGCWIRFKHLCCTVRLKGRKRRAACHPSSETFLTGRAKSLLLALDISFHWLVQEAAAVPRGTLGPAMDLMSHRVPSKDLPFYRDQHHSGLHHDYPDWSYSQAPTQAPFLPHRDSTASYQASPEVSKSKHEVCKPRATKATKAAAAARSRRQAEVRKLLKACADQPMTGGHVAHCPAQVVVLQPSISQAGFVANVFATQ